MEAQLGRLAGTVRARDAEAAALQEAVQAQFQERNELRSQVSALDAQLLRLQGAFADVEARLRVADEEVARLRAVKVGRCGWYN
jgi:chromosome segregation ATPase